MSNADIQFTKKKLIWHLYISNKALLTTKQVKLIDKKEFVKAVLDKIFKIIVVYVAALKAFSKLSKITIPPLQVIQFVDNNCVQIVALQQDETPIKVLSKYIGYANIFLFNLAIVLPENTSINKHIIELKKGKQLPYRLIYNLSLVELENLKTYIKIHLKTGFI